MPPHERSGQRSRVASGDAGTDSAAGSAAHRWPKTRSSTDSASFALFTLMWTVMMIAMMLPSSYPTLLMHRSVYRQRNPSRPGGTLLFASSYFVIWSATGALFYAAYVLVGHWRSTSASLRRRISAWLVPSRG